MQKRELHALIHTEWCRHLFRHGYIMNALGLSVFPLDSKANLSKEIAQLKKFEKKLITLCHDFDFRVDDARFEEDLELGISFGLVGSNTGKLSHGSAEHLAIALDLSRKKRLELEQNLKNVPRQKPGPENMPSEYAENVLVGLHLHSESTDGLKEFKAFISPNGGLERMLKKGGVSFAAKILLDRRADTDVRGKKGDIKTWRRMAQQQYERVIISNQVGYSIKSFAKHEAKLKKLRARVKSRANEILKKVKQRLA